jgi:hypothetical protein
MGKLESHSAKEADRRCRPIVTARFDDPDRARVTHRPFTTVRFSVSLRKAPAHAEDDFAQSRLPSAE